MLWAPPACQNSWQRIATTIALAYELLYDDACTWIPGGRT
jgi:hypothetical protein